MLLPDDGAVEQIDLGVARQGHVMDDADPGVVGFEDQGVDLGAAVDFTVVVEAGFEAQAESGDLSEQARTGAEAGLDQVDTAREPLHG